MALETYGDDSSMRERGESKIDICGMCTTHTGQKQMEEGKSHTNEL